MNTAVENLNTAPRYSSATIRDSPSPHTLPELFLRSAVEFDLPDALNFKKDGKWKQISSNEMVRRAENIALGLYLLGLRKGDRAAILAPNSPEWTLADAGCQFAGVIDVPIYTTLAGNAVKYIIDDSASRVVFLQDYATYEKLLSSIKDCKAIDHFVLFDADGVNDAELLSLEQVERLGEDLRTENSEIAAALRAAHRYPVSSGRCGLRTRLRPAGRA